MPASVHDAPQTYRMPSASRLTLLAAASLLTALAACSGPRPRGDAPADLPDAFPYHSAHQIQDHILQTADTLRAFRGKASLAVRSPKRSGSFSADVRATRTDSVYLSISPGLGIEAARALVTPDSFFVYDRIHNALTYGAVADAGDLLPAPFATSDLFPNLLGVLAPEAGVTWTVEADSAHYVLHDPSGLRSYVVDPARWRVVRYSEHAPDGTLVEERAFGEFDLFGSVYLPRRVVVRRPPEDVLATIYYRDLTLNPRGLTFALHVRSSADRILVE